MHTVEIEYALINNDYVFYCEEFPDVFVKDYDYLIGSIQAKLMVESFAAITYGNDFKIILKAVSTEQLLLQ